MFGYASVSILWKFIIKSTHLNKSTYMLIPTSNAIEALHKASYISRLSICAILAQTEATLKHFPGQMKGTLKFSGFAKFWRR